MRISVENGYIDYSIEADEVIVDNIKVSKQRKGTGTFLIKEVVEIARDLGKQVSLYSYPQDDTISQSELNDFYISLGFELSTDDVDERMFVY